VARFIGRERSLVLLGYEAGWAREPVWTLWREKNFLLLPGTEPRSSSQSLCRKGFMYRRLKCVLLQKSRDMSFLLSWGNTRYCITWETLWKCWCTFKIILYVNVHNTPADQIKTLESRIQPASPSLPKAIWTLNGYSFLRWARTNFGLSTWRKTQSVFETVEPWGYLTRISGRELEKITRGGSF
jgi:hypothetical protein